MPQHPYQATASANQPIQQSLFPSWHDRRHSNTSDAILEEGERKRGSFDRLQDIVKEKQKEEDGRENKDEGGEDSGSPKIKITKSTSDKVKSIVKDTTSYPPAIVIDNSELGETDASSDNKLEDTASAPAITLNEPEKKVRRSRSVRFNDDSDDKNDFIKTST